MVGAPRLKATLLAPNILLPVNAAAEVKLLPSEVRRALRPREQEPVGSQGSNCENVKNVFAKRNHKSCPIWRRCVRVLQCVLIRANRQMDTSSKSNAASLPQVHRGVAIAQTITGGIGKLNKLNGVTSNWQRFIEAAALVWEGLKFASSWHALFMVVATATATLFCAKGLLDFSFDFSMSIVAVGTVFPLVFSMQASFSRRERALSALARLKGTIFSTYLIFKTFDRTGDGEIAAKVEGLFLRLSQDIEWYMKSHNSAEAGHVVYDGFTALALKTRELLPKTGYSKPGEGGLSRLQVYIRDMMSDFEELRAVRDTETPIGLRLFCFALIHLSPILLAPYWLRPARSMHPERCRCVVRAERPAEH